jgi:DNA-binding transcriptional regulator YdaS (Cro superfamily)
MEDQKQRNHHSVKPLKYLENGDLKSILQGIERQFNVRIYCRVKRNSKYVDDPSLPPTKRLIQNLGGIAKVGKQLNMSHTAVWHWIKLDCIPAERVPTLVRMAREVGIHVNPSELRPDIDWEALK